MPKRVFLPQLEFLRAFAIILIVYTHVPWSSGREIDPILFTLFQNGSVFFLFISGFLFTFLNQEFHFFPYIKKKLLYVIVPYLLVVTLAIVSRGLLDSWWPAAEDIPWMVATGKPVQGPFWFIPMMGLFYLSTPLFHRLAKSRWAWWFLIPTLIISFVTWRPFNQMNPFLSYVHFFGIYHLGCVAGFRQEAFGRFCSRWLVMAAGLVVFLVAWRVEIVYDNSTFNSVFEDLFSGSYQGPDYSILQKLGLLVLSYGLSVRFIKKRWAVFRVLGEYSFGIFFIHSFIIDYAGQICGWQFDTWQSLVVGVIALGGSVAIVALIKLVFRKKSRYLIGC